MKITIDNSDQKSFEKLSPGDTFWFFEHLYLKIHTCNGMNAINLTSNHLAFFEGETVDPVNSELKTFKVK